MKNQITLEVAKIALCAVETVLQKTSPDAVGYPKLVEQYINAIETYWQAAADAENAMKPQAKTAA